MKHKWTTTKVNEKSGFPKERTCDNCGCVKAIGYNFSGDYTHSNGLSTGKAGECGELPELLAEFSQVTGNDPEWRRLDGLNRLNYKYVVDRVAQKIADAERRVAYKANQKAWRAKAAE